VVAVSFAGGPAGDPAGVRRRHSAGKRECGGGEGVPG
jgi:hypothetical protein